MGLLHTEHWAANILGQRMLATLAFPVPLLQSYCYGFHLLHFKNLNIAIQEFN